MFFDIVGKADNQWNWQIKWNYVNKCRNRADILNFCLDKLKNSEENSLIEHQAEQAKKD